MLQQGQVFAPRVSGRATPSGQRGHRTHRQKKLIASASAHYHVAEGESAWIS
jgi:hypothetical protein